MEYTFNLREQLEENGKKLRDGLEALERQAEQHRGALQYNAMLLQQIADAEAEQGEAAEVG